MDEIENNKDSAVAIDDASGAKCNASLTVKGEENKNVKDTAHVVDTSIATKYDISVDADGEPPQEMIDTHPKDKEVIANYSEGEEMLSDISDVFTSMGVDISDLPVVFASEVGNEKSYLQAIQKHKEYYEKLEQMRFQNE